MFDQRYRTYQCLHCKMCFLSRKERRTHVGKLHKSASQADSVRSHRVFVCPHCKVEWKSAKNTKKLEAFLEHLIRHKLGPKGLWCANCPDKFDTFNTLRRHVSATHLSSQTVCPQCGEICRDNHALKKHNQKAHVIKEDSPKKKEEIHVCDLCAKQFPSYGKLWYHKSSAHKDPSKYLTCEVCGKKLIDKTNPHQLLAPTVEDSFIQIATWTGTSSPSTPARANLALTVTNAERDFILHRSCQII